MGIGGNGWERKREGSSVRLLQGENGPSANHGIVSLSGSSVTDDALGPGAGEGEPVKRPPFHNRIGYLATHAGRWMLDAGWMLPEAGGCILDEQASDRSPGAFLFMPVRRLLLYSVMMSLINDRIRARARRLA